jgi:hypothetical protein
MAQVPFVVPSGGGTWSRLRLPLRRRSAVAAYSPSSRFHPRVILSRSRYSNHRAILVHVSVVIRVVVVLQFSGLIPDPRGERLHRDGC